MNRVHQRDNLLPEQVRRLREFPEDLFHQLFPGLPDVLALAGREDPMVYAFSAAIGEGHPSVNSAVPVAGGLPGQTDARAVRAPGDVAGLRVEARTVRGRVSSNHFPFLLTGLVGYTRPRLVSSFFQRTK